MKSNKIYNSIVKECERIDAGNGHRLAKKLTVCVLVELLPNKQRHIYESMTEEFQTAKEIADKAGIHTKEISPNVAQINSRGTLVTVKKIKGIVKYKKS